MVNVPEGNFVCPLICVARSFVSLGYLVVVSSEEVVSLFYQPDAEFFVSCSDQSRAGCDRCKVNSSVCLCGRLWAGSYGHISQRGDVPKAVQPPFDEAQINAGRRFDETPW